VNLARRWLEYIHLIKGIRQLLGNRIMLNCLQLKPNREETLYNSMGAAAKALNIDVCIISRYFNRNQIKPYKKRYVFTISKRET